MTSTPWYPDHVAYCISLSDIALSTWLAGELKWSRRTGERAVKGLTKRLGPDDPFTITAQFNLARTYLHLQEAIESHKLLKTVVQKRRLYFGHSHPDTLMARNELGMCLRAIGRLNVAEKIVANVLDSRRKLLGDEHAYTLWSVNDLSKVRCDRGDSNAAAGMLENIIPIVQRTLGEKHAGMIMTKSNLARAYCVSKRWGDAEGLLGELTTLIPERNAWWIHAMCGYIHVLMKLGRLDAAENASNELLDTVDKAKNIAMDDPRILATAEVLIGIYQAQGRLEDITKLKKKVPGANEPKSGQDALFTVLYGRKDDPDSRRDSSTIW